MARYFERPISFQTCRGSLHIMNKRIPSSKMSRNTCTILKNCLLPLNHDTCFHKTFWPILIGNTIKILPEKNALTSPCYDFIKPSKFVEGLNIECMLRDFVKYIIIQAEIPLTNRASSKHEVRHASTSCTGPWLEQYLLGNNCRCWVACSFCIVRD